MSTLGAVIFDLLDFVRAEVGLERTPATQSTAVETPHSLDQAIAERHVAEMLAEYQLRSPAGKSAEEANDLAITQFEAAEPDSLQLTDQWPVFSLPQQFFVAVPEAYGYVRPVRAFDGVATVISFGTKVTGLTQQGNWIEVAHKDKRVWLTARDLEVDKTLIEAQLAAGVIYEAQHDETIKIRTALHDMYAAVNLFLPLQDVELVTYRLKQAGRMIAWPRIHGRLAGEWQRLLRGVRGVHISIKPKTGAVFEWIDETAAAHLGYVQEVHPDNSILVEVVGVSVPGRYETLRLSAAEWHVRAGVFISVS